MKWLRDFWNWLVGRKKPRPTPTPTPTPEPDPVIIPIREPVQNDRNKRWFLLDSTHANYAATITTLTTLTSGHGETLTTTASRYTDVNVVYAYCTEQERDAATPSLTIGTAAVLDEMNYSVCCNPNYDGESTRTNQWGDSYTLYGVFLQRPQRLPTTGIDRIVAWWKNTGTDSVLFVGQTAGEDGSDGTSYRKRKAVADILASTASDATHNPTNYTILVLCGRLSRFNNEGAQGGLVAGSSFRIKSGSAGVRTQIVGHPVDSAEIMGGCKLGSGSWGEPASWTSEGGGVYSINVGATVTLGQLQHVMSDAGGTLRAITKKTTLAGCQATTDSYYIDTSGNDIIYVHLSDGSNPRTTTYVGESVSGGVSMNTTSTQYFDVFGVKFYQSSFVGNTGHGNFGFYACGFHYVTAGSTGVPMFKANGSSVNESTGAWLNNLTPDAPENRKIIGCEASHGYVFIYDTTSTYYVPINTTIRDCYLHHFNLLDDYGHNNFSGSDAHTITCQGCDGWYIENNRIDTVGSQPIVVYMNGNNYTTPTGGLELTDGYALGFGYPSRALDNGDGTHVSPSTAKNIHIADNLLTTILTAADDAGYSTNGQGIALQGGQNLIGILNQMDNNVIERNRLEGIFSEAAIRLKWVFLDGQTSYPIIRNNIIRGTTYGLQAIQTATINGVSYDPSFYFTGNDVHATSRFVYLVNIANPDHHLQHLDSNTYRNDAGAIWEGAGSATYATLALWRAAQVTGDVYDPNSTHKALGA